MKILVLSVLTLITLSFSVTAQKFEWAKRIGSTGNDQGHSIAIDASGNVYTTGFFQGTVDFDPGIGTSNLTSVGLSDVFISKLDPFGNLLWAKRIGGIGYDNVRSITIDASGNVNLTGTFYGTADFDPGPGVSNLTSNGGYDIFISKLDSTGNLIWAKSIGGTSSENVYSIATDASGNVYTTGSFSDTVDFDPGIGVFNFTSPIYTDIFISKLDSLGNFIWAKQLGGIRGDVGRSIAIDSFGNVYTSGTFSNTVDFDPGAGISNLTAGFSHVFILKLDSSGSFIWAKSMGGSSYNEGFGMTIDASGNVYSTGRFRGTSDFNPGAGVSNFTSAGDYDVFISKLDASGNFIWAKSIGGTGEDKGCDIAVDAFGNVYTTGAFRGTFDFDPGIGTVNLTSNGWSDIFILKLDSSGNFIWATKMGGPVLDYGNSLAVDASLNVFATGHFQGTADFDPGTGIYNLTSNGNFDVFILKLCQCCNTGSDVQTACNSYTWIDGNTYTTSNNIATHTLTNAAGCDSVVTLDLNVFYSNTGIDTQTACDSYTWIDGNTYITSNNSATYTLTNAVGCDSVVTLNLTINANTGTDTQTTCNSYTWIDGNTYTASNNSATHTLTNVAGCDSVVTLDLNVFYSNTGIDTQTACDSYTWIDGATYTSSNNSATHTLTNESGCDSVITLDLIVNYSNTGTDTQTGCNSYTWIDGNTYTTSNNIATHTLTNAAGCDSVVTLDLNVYYSNTGIDTQTACDSYTWIDGNTYITSNHSATYTLTNAVGCDSVITLNLTINSNTGTDTQTACNSYTWINGITYTTSNNSATHTLTNASGCDSVVTLNLTINSNTGTDTQTGCNSYTWIDGTTYTSSNNSATHTLTNALGCDSVVTLDLIVNYSNTGIDTQVACNSYTWIDGTTYTSSNNSATHTLTNALGCDSVVTLDLIVNYSNAAIDTRVGCNSYTWIDGNTYTTSNNSATYTFTNVAGCDSIVTLDLTVNYSNTGVDTQMACNSYAWIDGNTYSTSNNSATHTLTNSAGCDSVVTLNLSINSNTGTDTQSACDTFTWIDGNTYTTSNNTASHTLTNAAGCDSVVTLDLIVFYSNTGTDTQIACDSYTWLDGNTYTTSNNTATHNLANAVGCDSIVTLDLIINYSNTSIDTQSTCNIYTWIDGNIYTTSNNSATYTLTNAAGCDSVVTLNLSINSNTGIDTQIACNTYTWIDGNTYTTSNNSATYTLTNAAGCDSVITLDLTINTIDVTVSTTSPTITANTAGATYQWLDCNNSYSQITGETSQTYTATANGNYAVEVTENGCTDTSACVAIINIGINEVESDRINIYPNPTSSKLNIENGGLEIIAIRIIDVKGKTVRTIDEKEDTIDVSKLAKGIYFLQIEVGSSVINEKFVKE